MFMDLTEMFPTLLYWCWQPWQCLVCPSLSLSGLSQNPKPPRDRILKCSRNGDPRYRMAYRMRDVKCYS